MTVTLKLATSLDGRIATASGESKWITGPQAREQGHRLRAAHQMIVVGVETAIADDPELTVRLPAYMGEQPARVVFDSRQRLARSAKLVRSAEDRQTIVVSTGPPEPDLVQAGVTVLTVEAEDGRPSISSALDALAAWRREDARRRLAGITSPFGTGQQISATLEPALAAGDLMVEGGGQLAASFLAAGVVDRIEWFRAPIVLGDEGRPGIGAFVLKDLAGAPRFRRTHVEALGDDLWERYERL